MSRKDSVKARTEQIKAGITAQNRKYRRAGNWKSGKSNGSEGLEKARAKRRVKKMKELAKSDNAFTVKVALPWQGNNDPNEVVGMINDFACRLNFFRYDGKSGHGRIVRAEVTDAKEVWARVVPDEKSSEIIEKNELWVNIGIHL